MIFMYDILAGKQRSLVFPIMCNAHVKLDYSDNIVDTSGDGSVTDDVAYGIWAHTGSFTFESVITPYDINGYGTYSGLTAPSVTASKRIMPGISQSEYTATKQNKFQSEVYLPRASRITHEMMIFYSTNFQISLVNVTTKNENQPAEYKIRVRLKLGSTTDTIDTGVIIKPLKEHRYKQTANNPAYEAFGINKEGNHEYRAIGLMASHSAGANNFTVTRLDGSSAGTDFHEEGQELFITRSSADSFIYESLGTTTNKSGATITVSSAISSAIPSSTVIYSRAYAHPNYINDAFHIACAYDNSSKKIDIFFNGALVKSAKHTQTDDYSFSKEDYFIGANGSGATGANSATTNKQFMGEFHELAISSLSKTKFNSLFNLLPNFDKTLVYLRFEEVDV